MFELLQEIFLTCLCGVFQTVRYCYGKVAGAAPILLNMKQALAEIHQTEPDEYTTPLFNVDAKPVYDRLFPHVTSITFEYDDNAKKLDSTKALELRSIIEELRYPTVHEHVNNPGYLYLLLRRACIRCSRSSTFGAIQWVVAMLSNNRCGSSDDAAWTTFPKSIHICQNQLLMSMTSCKPAFQQSETDGEQNMLTVLQREEDA